MPSGWNVYYILFLSALAALLIPGALWLVARAAAPKGSEASASPRPSPRDPSLSQLKLNSRVFLAANATLLLIGLGLLLIPVVVWVGRAPSEGASREAVFRGVLLVLSVAFFAAIGLLYAYRKGDLSWLTTFRARGEKKS